MLTYLGLNTQVTLCFINKYTIKELSKADFDEAIRNLIRNMREKKRVGDIMGIIKTIERLVPDIDISELLL